MDGFVEKPVRSEIIRATLSRYAGDKSDKQTAPVFDRAELLERLGGNPELLPRFLQMFITNAAETMSALRSSITNGDAMDIHRHAHTIKGAAANIGADRILACASRMDDMAKSGKLEGIAQQMELLKSEYDHFVGKVAGML